MRTEPASKSRCSRVEGSNPSLTGPLLKEKWSRESKNDSKNTSVDDADVVSPVLISMSSDDLQLCRLKFSKADFLKIASRGQVFFISENRLDRACDF